MISSTYRPVERSCLMHYSSKLERKEMSAEAIPVMSGVDIEWKHATETASRTAAIAMARGYNIVFPPALISNHTSKLAIDMTITNIVGKNILNADGDSVKVKLLSDLNRVGATDGVFKLVRDRPHWSCDGR